MDQVTHWNEDLPDPSPAQAWRKGKSLLPPNGPHVFFLKREVEEMDYPQVLPNEVVHTNTEAFGDSSLYLMGYPPAIFHITMERATVLLTGKHHFDWAMFHNYVANYQRVSHLSGANAPMTLLLNSFPFWMSRAAWINSVFLAAGRHRCAGVLSLDCGQWRKCVAIADALQQVRLANIRGCRVIGKH